MVDRVVQVLTFLILLHQRQNCHSIDLIFCQHGTTWILESIEQYR